MSDNLLPCPFCGCKAVFDEVTDEDNVVDFGGHFVRCTRCLGSLGLKFANKEDPRPHLAQMWNRRASSKQAADVAGEEQGKSRHRDLEHLSSERRRGLEEAAQMADVIACNPPKHNDQIWPQACRAVAKAIRALIPPSSEGDSPEEKT